jgi:hypothetical protein
MIHQSIQEIDLWEAWIEFDHVSPELFGTLYVVGEVLLNKKDSHPYFLKCVTQNEPETLMLKIETSTSSALNKIAEMVYSENLENINQYSSIKVYKDNELLVHIEDIEVLI